MSNTHTTGHTGHAGYAGMPAEMQQVPDIRLLMIDNYD